MRTGLEGKVAIVFGAARGSGVAVAQTLAAGGARIVCVDDDAAQVHGVAEEITATGAACTSVAGDLLSREFVRSVVREAAAEFGRVDVGIDVGDGARRESLLVDAGEGDFEATFDAIVRRFFVVSQEVFRLMVDLGTGGSFVAASSALALTAAPRAGVFAAANAMLTSLVRTVAVEVGPHDIRLNAVAPGSARADEVAAVVAFLASDLSSFITGQTILADEGRMLQTTDRER